MAIITATSPIKGVEPGETVDVPDGEAAWLLAQGYATDDDTEHDHLYDTSTDASLDPTLAENREGRDEPFTYKPGVEEPPAG